MHRALLSIRPALLALATLTFVVASPVGAVDDPLFPPIAEPENPDEIDFPDGFDPSLPEVEWHAEMGAYVNKETDLAFDPYARVIIDIFGGEFWDADTGEPIDLFDLPPPDAGAFDDPVAPAERGDVAPADQFPGFENLEDRDPVLQHYRLETDLADLGEFALDPADFPDGALDEAFQFIAYEIALLFELGALDQNTSWYPTFAAVNEKFDLDDVEREQLLGTFTAVDNHLAARSTWFGPAMTNDDLHVQWAIQEIPPLFQTQLRRGDFAFLNGYEYAAGLLRLMATGADVEVTTTGSTTAELEVALARAIAELEIQDDLNDLLRLENEALLRRLTELSNPALDPFASEPVDRSDGGSPLALYAGIGAGVVLLLALVGLALGRRRSRAAKPDAVRYDVDETVATAQLLAGAKNEDEIVAVLDRAAVRQLGTPVELFHATPDGLLAAGGNLIVTDSDLQRVVDTGQRVMTILENDPAFGLGSHAVIALPVIHGRQVQAVLAAHRPGDTPFTDADLQKLEPIAPALGGALERAAELGTMSQLAMIDGLTSLGNRRRLDGDLETTLATAVAGEAPLGFAMIDVDHFKAYNDTHGHSAGDEILRRVAATIARCVRESDVVYRYGGEEFSMLLPGASPEEAAAVAERVRATIETEAFPGEELQPGGRLTVSIGVATLASGGPDDLRDRADRALYRAKEAGRNQVAFA